MAVNAVKGMLGGSDNAGEEVSKHAKKASSGADDGISKALESLRKSGKASPMCLLDPFALFSLLRQKATKLVISEWWAC